jgi:hypothetical protein
MMVAEASGGGSEALQHRSSRTEEEAKRSMLLWKGRDGRRAIYFI